LRLACAAAFIVSAVVTGAWPELTRAGYSPDEEFTTFAIRGISATGLPVLPSGLLYDRGVGYSYAAWLMPAWGGDTLIGARAVSFASALAALIPLWFVVRGIAGDSGAALAVLLVAFSLPFWVVATSARFYASFLALYLTSLALLFRTARGNTAPGPRAGLLCVLALAAAACRLTHELAFALAAVPICCMALAPARERSTWMRASFAVVSGLVAAQASLFVLHFLVPESGGTMIRRFFVWQVLNLFERPPLAAPLGILLVATTARVLITGHLPGPPFRTVGARSALVLATAILALAAVTSFDRVLDYPLDLFWHLARTTPPLVVSALALLVARACGIGGAWTPAERAVHLLWLGWVVFFGVIESGITINYLLVPVTLMLAAIAIDLAAIGRRWQARPALRIAVTLVGALVVGACVWSQWGNRPHAQLTRGRPTIVVPDPIALGQTVADAGLVACTDELACLLLVGRIDRWLALDDFLRERFLVSRASGDVGVYTGAPAVHRIADLVKPHRSGAAPARVLVIDVFKDLPVGNSAAFLPRALAEEGVLASTLLETSQLRVVEIEGLLPRPAVASLLARRALLTRARR
jgi:hypothetical protein